MLSIWRLARTLQVGLMGLMKSELRIIQQLLCELLYDVEPILGVRGVSEDKRHS